MSVTDWVLWCGEWEADEIVYWASRASDDEEAVCRQGAFDKATRVAADALLKMRAECACYTNILTGTFRLSPPHDTRRYIVARARDWANKAKSTGRRLHLSPLTAAEEAAWAGIWAPVEDVPELLAAGARGSAGGGESPAEAPALSGNGSSTATDSNNPPPTPSPAQEQESLMGKIDTSALPPHIARVIEGLEGEAAAAKQARDRARQISDESRKLWEDTQMRLDNAEEGHALEMGYQREVEARLREEIDQLRKELGELRTHMVMTAVPTVPAAVSKSQASEDARRLREIASDLQSLAARMKEGLDVYEAKPVVP